MKRNKYKALNDTFYHEYTSQEKPSVYPNTKFINSVPQLNCPKN